MQLMVALSAILCFAISALLGKKLIPLLHKLHFGQTILDIGPNWHKNKQGTPTMGGFMFIIGIVVSALVGYFLCQWRGGDWDTMTRIRFFSAILTALAFGFMGFLDDYVKVSKKQNEGLTAGQKLIFQFVIGIAYLATLYLSGDTSTTIIFPFLGQIDFKLFYYPIVLVGLVYFVNSVNLTDGIDGLASSVTFVAAIAMLIFSLLLDHPETMLLSALLAAGCLGFLVWNFHPAKVFMGDTGSMFLGGLLVCLGFSTGIPLILFFFGIIYIIESMSVVLQVISYKTTGKRIFKMSPIHHHYEMSGWSEVKIVIVFSAVTLVMSAVGLLSLKTL